MSDYTEDGLKDYTDGYYWSGSLGTFGIPEGKPREGAEGSVDYHWSAVISSQGRKAQYSWSQVRESGPHNRYSGRIEALEGFDEGTDSGSVELIPFEGAAQSLRRRELSLEVDSAGLLDDHRLLRQAVLELFERAYRGEFLGQSGSADLLSVEEVAEILWINPQLILAHIRSLVVAGKLVREDV